MKAIIFHRSQSISICLSHDAGIGLFSHLSFSSGDENHVYFFFSHCSAETFFSCKNSPILDIFI
jgi:hypothetical protein